MVTSIIGACSDDRSVPAPGETDARPEAVIDLPAAGAEVPRTFDVAGRVVGDLGDRRVFLVAQSASSGSVLFPLGEIDLDEDGRFRRSATLLFEYPHRLNVVATAEPAEIGAFTSSRYRYYGVEPEAVDPLLLGYVDVVRVDGHERLGASGTHVISRDWPPRPP